MNAQQLTAEVDPTEILATASLDDPRLTPPEHIINIASLALHNPRYEISSEVAAFFHDWLHDQKAIQALATEVLAKLEQQAPLPTPSDIINGTAQWPGWMTNWWAEVLRFPWAGRLGEAVTEAWGWLDGQP